MCDYSGKIKNVNLPHENSVKFFDFSFGEKKLRFEIDQVHKDNFSKSTKSEKILQKRGKEYSTMTSDFLQ